MAEKRKLLNEIDKCYKKIEEGFEIFDDIMAKMAEANSENQREKFQDDLKKEIKKLQRLRDQIKGWQNSSDIKDKDSLSKFRKLIEQRMEIFKDVERENKMKPHSKQGLTAEDKLDPKEKEKSDTIEWLNYQIRRIQDEIDRTESKLETLSSTAETGKKRGKKDEAKRNEKEKSEELRKHLERVKFHLLNLEVCMRMINNEKLEIKDVLSKLKDPLEMYIDALDPENDDDPESLDPEDIYEELNFSTYLSQLGGISANSIDDERGPNNDTGSHKSSSPPPDFWSSSTQKHLNGGELLLDSSQEKTPLIGGPSSVSNRSTSESVSSHRSAVSGGGASSVTSLRLSRLGSQVSNSSAVSSPLPQTPPAVPGIPYNSVAAGKMHTPPVQSSTTNLFHQSSNLSGAAAAATSSSVAAKAAAAAFASTSSTTTNPGMLGGGGGTITPTPTTPSSTTIQGGGGGGTAFSMFSSNDGGGTEERKEENVVVASSVAAAGVTTVSAAAATSSSSSSLRNRASSVTSSTATAHEDTPQYARNNNSTSPESSSTIPSKTPLQQLSDEMMLVSSESPPIAAAAATTTTTNAFSLAPHAATDLASSETPAAAGAATPTARINNNTAGGVLANRNRESLSLNSESPKSNDTNTMAAAAAASAAATTNNDSFEFNGKMNVSNLLYNSASFVGSMLMQQQIDRQQQRSREPQTAIIQPWLGASPLGMVPLNEELSFQLQMLDSTVMRCPVQMDSEKPRSYLPKMPCQTPPYYPQAPLPNADSLEYYLRLSVETLFFTFYYMEGSRAQLLAAKALKKLSWRFHTKYLMWFQRHEEPKQITDDYEQGTYVYFDFEKWVQRKKEQFTFEYKYLEDKDFE